MKIFLNSHNGKKQIDVSQNDTLGSIRHKISTATGLKFFALNYNGQSIQDGKTLGSYGIKNGATLEITPLMDIGVFDHHVNAPCRQFLLNIQADHPEQKIHDLIKGLRGNEDAEFLIQNLDIPAHRIDAVRNYADSQFAEVSKKGLPKEETDDLKIELTREKLMELIGEDVCLKLEQLYAENPTEILIRRCQSHGKMINFHTDVSLKTLQLSLNSDSDYEGGRLLYVCKGKIFKPERRQGTVTIHNNQIVHGVTQFESGVRYGLLFLQK